MGGHWNGRTREAERIAGQAWDELISAIESGGDTARSFAKRTAELADDAGDRLRPAVRESRRRAGAAIAALSGRRPPIQWELILAGAVGGAVLGWLAGTMTRKAAEEQFILHEAVAERDAPAFVDPETSLS
jgi:hypothetical protein